MGVRQSKLDLVPSLALGTSPVSLKEMVSAYATIANAGAYREPVLVTRIENSKGEVLAEFAPAPPEPALSAEANYILLDALRGVVDKGTGAAIRGRFGLRADLAGKTGTTQDNADGWFILMHPQLVMGAWVGFNDGRVTLRSDYWGQGAHSALPIVGDFTVQALRARAIDSRARFAPPQDTGFFSLLRDRLRDWATNAFGPEPEPARPPAATPGSPPEPMPAPEPAATAEPAASPVEPQPEEIILPPERPDPVETEAEAQMPPASAPAAPAPEAGTPEPSAPPAPAPVKSEPVL
jgi:penicillin-binding protein 1A